MLETRRKKTLIKALGKLNQHIKLSSNLDNLLSSVSPLGRRRDSNLYLIGAKFDAYPDGIVIKIASNESRIARWNPLEEAERLDKISTIGPKAKKFSYLQALYASENPHFIALPYFPSLSLRNSVELLKNHVSNKDTRGKTIGSFYWAGKWLGMLCNLSPHNPLNSNAITREVIQDRIAELKPYSNDLELETLSSYIESLCKNHQRALEINPEYFHGDFNLDNVLVHSDGRLCLVDPEPIRIGLFADFIHFRRSMIILSNRGFKNNRPSQPEKFIQAFCDGFAEEFEEYPVVAHVYLLSVINKVSRYYKQGYKNAISITPRGLISWYDQRKLMRYWIDWLNNLPQDPGELWSYIRSTL